MSQERYRYELTQSVPAEEIEASLLLAMLSAESLHGETQVRLDVTYDLDKEGRVCTLDAGTDAGRDVNRLFAGFLRGQFGEDSFRVDRLEGVAAEEARA